MTYDDWIDDIPCQFKDGKNTKILLKVLSKQIDELIEMFYGIRDKTTLDVAVGKNLDMLGDIINISRGDAFEQLRADVSTQINDDLYRNVLKFQEIKNNTDASYGDIMKGLYLLWGERTDITYVENENKPATVNISINDLGLDEADPVTSRPLVIHGGGVNIVFQSNYKDNEDLSSWEKFEGLTLTWRKRHYWNAEYDFDGEIQWNADEIEEEL